MKRQMHVPSTRKRKNINYFLKYLIYPTNVEKINMKVKYVIFSPSKMYYLLLH